MKTKLTLSIEKSVIDAAKEVAKEHGISLSRVIETHLQLLVGRRKEKEVDKETDKESIVEKLRGCVKLDDDRDYREIVAEEMMKKYNRLK